MVLWRGLGSRLGVYETHPLGVFRELRFVDGFLKLVPRYSGLLAPSAGQLLGVQGKEPLFDGVYFNRLALFDDRHVNGGLFSGGEPIRNPIPI